MNQNASAQAPDAAPEGWAVDPAIRMEITAAAEGRTRPLAYMELYLPESISEGTRSDIGRRSSMFMRDLVDMISGTDRSQRRPSHDPDHPQSILNILFVLRRSEHEGR